MAEKNTANIGFENKSGMRPRVVGTYPGHQNIET